MAPTPAIKRHWDRVAGLGCILSQLPATIAHCHGGSISDELGYEWRPGMAERQNHWLVLPLAPRFHQGDLGLDTFPRGVRAWEAMFRPQTELLEELSWQLGYCVYERAGVRDYGYRTFSRPGVTSDP